MSPFPRLLNCQLEVSESGKWLVGVRVTVTDLLQNSAKYRVFGHPTRDAFDSVTVTDGSCMTFRTATRSLAMDRSAWIVSHMGVAVKVPHFCHGHIDERSVSSG